MKHFFSLLTILTFATTLVAQRYNTAVGLRLSNGAGITIQQRIADQWTIEGIAMTNFNGNSDVIGLAEYHGKIVFQKRLNWYVGGGPHFGNHEGSTLGAALVGGLEFTIKRLNLSADVIVMSNFTGGTQALEFNPGVSVRYVLVKRPRKTLRDRIGKKRKGKKNKEGGKLKDIFNRN
jgi:hypothetical protein